MSFAPDALELLKWGGPGWLSGLGCAAVSFWHARRVEERRCPGVIELVRRAKAAGAHHVGEAARAAAQAELADIRAEAARSLALATLIPRGMARIALASGTAVAVLGLARGVGDGAPAVTIAAVVAFSGGAFGAVIAAMFGRRARDHAAEWRAGWKRELAAAELELSRTEELGGKGSAS